jgi:glycosyltransferase involved in cell wall biosynthesis
MGLIVNIISNDNGVGLTKDYQLLKGIIEQFGGICNHVSSLDKRMAHRKVFHEAIDADLNIFLEHYYAVDILRHKAKINILFPNPEWFFEKQYVKKFDAIFAKTRHSERVFKGLGGNVFFSSFTSEDKRLDIKKDNQFIHVAGKSSMKNTDAVFEAWSRDSKLPMIFLLSQNKKYFTKENINYVNQVVEEGLFDKIFNKCRFHVCPSQYEGFGHYIWEAMSCENVVITSNHEPMNKIIEDTRFHVKGRIERQQGYGQLFKIDSSDLQKKARYLMSLSDAEIELIGKVNRQAWEDNDRFFRNNMKGLFEHL